MSMIYYVCNYADYTNLPDKLFCENNPLEGSERMSLDGLRFIARCEEHTIKNGCLSWMNGNEPSFSHSGILAEIGIDTGWVAAEL